MTQKQGDARAVTSISQYHAALAATRKKKVTWGAGFAVIDIGLAAGVWMLLTISDLEPLLHTTFLVAFAFGILLLTAWFVTTSRELINLEVLERFQGDVQTSTETQHGYKVPVETIQPDLGVRVGYALKDTKPVPVKVWFETEDSPLRVEELAPIQK